MHNRSRWFVGVFLTMGLVTAAPTVRAMSVAPVFGKAAHGLQLAYFYDAFAPEGRATFVLKNTTNQTMEVYVRNSCTGYEPFSIEIKNGNAPVTKYALGEKFDCQASQSIYQTVKPGEMTNVSVIYPHPPLKKGTNQIYGVLETRYPFVKMPDSGKYEMIRLESPSETRVVK